MAEFKRNPFSAWRRLIHKESGLELLDLCSISKLNVNFTVPPGFVVGKKSNFETLTLTARGREKTVPCTLDWYSGLQLTTEFPGVTAQGISSILNCDPDAANHKDGDDWYPLHRLCQNRDVTLEMLTVLASQAPGVVKEKNNDGNYALYLLWLNESATAEMRTALTGYYLTFGMAGAVTAIELEAKSVMYKKGIIYDEDGNAFRVGGLASGCCTCM